MFLEFTKGDKNIIIDANHITVVQEDDDCCLVVLSNGDEYTVTNSYSDIRDALFRNEED